MASDWLGAQPTTQEENEKKKQRKTKINNKQTSWMIGILTWVLFSYPDSVR